MAEKFPVPLDDISVHFSESHLRRVFFSHQRQAEGENRAWTVVWKQRGNGVVCIISRRVKYMQEWKEKQEERKGIKEEGMIWK